MIGGNLNYYTRYYRGIVTKGEPTKPRGYKCVTLYNQKFSFTAGQTWRREHDNPAIGFIEGLQLIAGIADREAIQAAAPRVDIALFGPVSFYGPRVVDQVPRVIDELREDPFSRRAVLLVSHPTDTMATMPCTTAIHFYRSGEGRELLDMTVDMRSSDAVWGLPYDVIQFGMLQHAVAACLGCFTGTSVVNIINAHVYEDHQVEGRWWEERWYMPVHFSEWAKYQQWAADMTARKLIGLELRKLFELTKVERSAI